MFRIEAHNSMPSKKRLFDFLASFSVLIFAIPLGILAYPFLRFFIGDSIIFVQERIGFNGRKFKLYKLRSMKKNADAIKKKYFDQNEAPSPMFKIADDPRFIKKRIFLFGKKREFEVGKFLSRSGLDEIPQFINILKGEMSLIGPRPLPVEEAIALKRIDVNWYQWRHSVKPGVFSIWAADSKHNQSFNYWKKLEKETLKMSFLEEIAVIFKIIFKQIKGIVKEHL